MGVADMLVSFKANISDVESKVASMKSGVASVASAAQSASSQMSSLSWLDGNKIVSNVDVAQAKLTLIESKVTEARSKLQTLQNAANAGEAVTGIAEAEAQLTLLESDAQNARKSLQELSTSTMSFGERVSSMAGSIMDFGSKLGMAAMGFQMLGQMAMNTASALLQPAATAETTQLSFETLMHSTSAAKDMMVQLNTYAASTPMETQWVDDAASKFLAFGFKAQDVIPDITAIGDSLSGLGKLTAPSLNSIVDIFGKIQAQGKLTGGDMMQLSTWGIPAWQALSTAMHKPIPELQQMVSAGLIPADVAIKALRTGMESTFGGGMQKQANTFTGIVSTLKSNFNIAMAALGSPLLKVAEQGLGKISDILASPSFQAFATSVGQKIGDTLGRIATFVTTNVVPAFQKLGPVISKIGDYLKSDQFAGIIADFQTLGNQIGRLLGPVQQLQGPLSQLASGALAALPGLVQNLATAADNVIFPLGQFLIWMQQAGPWQDIIKAGLIGIGAAFAAMNIGAFLATLPALLAGLGVWAAEMAAIAVETIIAAAPFVLIGAIIAIVVAGIVLAVMHWGEISKWLQGVWAAFSSWFMSTMGAVGAWFQGLWAGIVSVSKSAWSGFSSWFMSALGAIGAFFTGVWNGIKAGLQAAWSGIVAVVRAGAAFLLQAILGPFVAIGAAFIWLYNHNTYFKAMIDAIVGFVRGGVAWLQNAWSVSVAFIAAQWQRLVSWASSTWSSISTAISGAVQAVWSWLVSVWTTIATWINQQWQRLASWASSTWNMITAAIQSAAQAAWAWLVSIWTTAATWLQAQWNKFSTFAQAAWQAVSTVFSSIWTTYISTPMQKLWNQFTKWFSDLATQATKSAQNFIKMLADGISSGAGTIYNAVVGIANTIWKALGFHSPAKEGPGSDADKWMPNLVNMLSSGLQAGQPKIAQASYSLASSIAQPYQSSYPQRSSVALAGVAAASSGASTSGGAPQTIILEIDGRQFTKTVVGPNLDKEVRLKLGARGRSI